MAPKTAGPTWLSRRVVFCLFEGEREIQTATGNNSLWYYFYFVCSLWGGACRCDVSPPARGAAPVEVSQMLEQRVPYEQDQSRGAAELLRRQEELERKAAELDRREREMQSLSASGGRKNNWPPLPENLPVGPCFYHDITVDIPVEFQKTVKIMYYLWMFHTGTLLANLIGCLAWFCVDASRGVDFGLAILWFMLFTPCSFVCWYRPL
uniref:Secretory carrier-associated membrane protein n=1 Tax=Labrus bergylta TaxID=56723 RepID=A0A3Q3F5D9_9LABR